MIPNKPQLPKAAPNYTLLKRQIRRIIREHQAEFDALAKNDQ